MFLGAPRRKNHFRRKMFSFLVTALLTDLAERSCGNSCFARLHDCFQIANFGNFLVSRNSRFHWFWDFPSFIRACVCVCVRGCDSVCGHISVGVCVYIRVEG